MSTRREGPWIVHRVEATSPAGRRIAIDVPAKDRHTGSVAVRWDPSGTAEPRFVGDRSTWWLWAAALMIVVVIAVVVWQFVI